MPAGPRARSACSPPARSSPGRTATPPCSRLLQLRRPWLAVAAGALSLGFSPLAFAFLCLVLAAVAVGRRPGRRTLLVVTAGLGAVAVLQLVLMALFPSPGRYPFNDLSLAAALTVSALGAALAYRV